MVGTGRFQMPKPLVLLAKKELKQAQEQKELREL
jgi:hypothetical protein